MRAEDIAIAQEDRAFLLELLEGGIESILELIERGGLTDLPDSRLGIATGLLKQVCIDSTMLRAEDMEEARKENWPAVFGSFLTTMAGHEQIAKAVGTLVEELKKRGHLSEGPIWEN